MSRDGAANDKLPMHVVLLDSDSLCLVVTHGIYRNFNIPSFTAVYMAPWETVSFIYDSWFTIIPQKETLTSLTIKKTTTYYFARKMAGGTGYLS